jgi:hypothetical protein
MSPQFNKSMFEDTVNASFVILSGAKDLAEWRQSRSTHAMLRRMMQCGEILRSAQDDNIAKVPISKRALRQFSKQAR